MRIILVLAPIMFACVGSKSLECTPDLICPQNQKCDLAHHGCVDADQLTACNGHGDGDDCTAASVLLGTCDQNVCLAPRCGDGYVEGLEECDGDALDGMTCQSLGFYDPGTPKCGPDCRFLDKDASGCTGYCGDSVVRIGEELCDGNTPPIGCIDLGYGAGALGCTFDCGPAVDKCTLFGWSQRSMPTRIADVHGTTNENVFAISQQAPTIYYYDGLDWAPVDLSGCALQSTESFSAGNVWTVGQHEAFATSIVGTGRVVQVTPTGCTKHAFAKAVYDVWGTSSSNVYAVNADGIHHWNGTAWTIVDSTPRHRIWGSGPNDIWAAATGSNVLMHSDGTTWTSPKTLTTVTTVTALWGTAQNNVYAAGSNGTTTDSVYRYDGNTWTEIYSAAYSMGIRSGTYAHGHPIAGFGNGKVISYDGTRWATLLEAGTFNAINGMWTAPSEKILAGVVSAPLLIGFEGTTRIDLPTFGTGAERLAFKSENEAYVVRIFDQANASVYLWNGTTWTQETNGGANVGDVWVDTTGAVRSIDYDNGMKLRTGANTWSTVSGVAPGFRAWGVSGADFWVLPSAGGMQHYVGGVLATCSSCPTTAALRDLWGTSSSNVFAVGLSGKIYHWDGASVTDMPSGTTDALLTVHGSPDGAHVWAAGNNGTLLHFTGTSWETVPYPALLDAIQSVWGTSPNDLFAGQSAEIFHWDGANWSAIAARAIGRVTDMESLGDTLMYIDSGGNSGNLATPHRLVRIAPWPAP